MKLRASKRVKRSCGKSSTRSVRVYGNVCKHWADIPESIEPGTWLGLSGDGKVLALKFDSKQVASGFTLEGIPETSVMPLKRLNCRLHELGSDRQVRWDAQEGVFRIYTPKRVISPLGPTPVLNRTVCPTGSNLESHRITKVTEENVYMERLRTTTHPTFKWKAGNREYFDKTYQFDRRVFWALWKYSEDID